MANLKDVIYLSAEDYNTLYTNGTVTINGTTLTYDANNVYIVPDNTQQQIDDILALIPSGATSSNKLATADDIPTIPSNNVTGSGTSGSLTKFNGTNTITDGPALSSTISSQTQSTKFLREDGSWAAPSYTNIGGKILSGSTYINTSGISTLDLFNISNNSQQTTTSKTLFVMFENSWRNNPPTSFIAAINIGPTSDDIQVISHVGNFGSLTFTRSESNNTNGKITLNLSSGDIQGVVNVMIICVSDIDISWLMS